MIWHGTTRQGALPPHVDWQQAPAQAYCMVADPWPLAVLLQTIYAPKQATGTGLGQPPHAGLEP